LRQPPVWRDAGWNRGDLVELGGQLGQLWVKRFQDRQRFLAWTYRRDLGRPRRQGARDHPDQDLTACRRVDADLAHVRRGFDLGAGKRKPSKGADKTAAGQRLMDMREVPFGTGEIRSEERRVGKECRNGWLAYR